MTAYLGVTVSGFPNLFMLLGPNTGLGHNSVVLMIEAQVGYVMKCLKLMRQRNISAMEVRAESQRHFVTNLHDHMARTVWQSGGCRSWYQDTRSCTPGKSDTVRQSSSSMVDPISTSPISCRIWTASPIRTVSSTTTRGGVADPPMVCSLKTSRLPLTSPIWRR